MIGVIIARFQTPYLHPGHQALIESVQSKHKRLVIVLGVSPVLGSKHNPLDFHTREKMIKKYYPDVVVLPLADHPLDTVWSVNLDNLLMNTFPGAGFMLFGSRNSFINYYSGKCKVHELAPHGEFSASQIRDSIKEQVMDAMEFRAGIIYAYANTYPKVYPTVDVAVFRNNKKEILLGKKDNDQKWRLIGGFTDPTDEGFESAAMRELKEECGDISVARFEYEGSFGINDWRYKNETDRIITTLFSTDYIAGEPKGNDDIAEVRWFPIRDLPEMISNGLTTVTHDPLFNVLLNKYLK
ncbi:MAG TPA: NUDIX domain-containing protein [Ohtaekwangia sp.]|nr:NUDIX domain-containing protein [Ohtaekwangia sp.]